MKLLLLWLFLLPNETYDSKDDGNDACQSENVGAYEAGNARRIECECCFMLNTLQLCSLSRTEIGQNLNYDQNDAAYDQQYFEIMAFLLV
ncbi:MAG: hypothetical protein E7467_06195 [Ruminococcaceae bacterium]|nr:hypothetical protein [Oscillospiraceae bacterium]